MSVDEVAKASAAVLFIAAVFAVSADYMTASWEYESDAVVLDRVFTPSSTSLVSVDGKIGTAIDSEKWTVVAEVDGQIATFAVDKDIWQRVHAGSTVRVYRLRGRFLDFGKSLF